MNKFLLTNKLKFINCSNSACNKIFQISSKEVEHGNGVSLCPDCFPKPKTHHTIECASCLTIIDFLTLDENENATTFYSQKCFVCSGSIDDEIHISKSNTIQAFIHS